MDSSQKNCIRISCHLKTKFFSPKTNFYTECLIFIAKSFQLNMELYNDSCSEILGDFSNHSSSSSDGGVHIVDLFSYWCEGIGILAIGIPGLLGNFVSAVILSTSDEMKANVFNYLLTGLSIVDSMLIVLSCIDYSIVRGLNMHFNWYGHAFPYFIYPAVNIVLCLSIFVVVAIAYERYVAVCKPFAYRVAVYSQSALSRAFKLLLPVVILAILINVPKYFETFTVEVRII